MWNHAKLSLFFRISQIFCRLLFGGDMIWRFTVAFVFNSNSTPPPSKKKGHNAFSSISPYGTKHHPGIHQHKQRHRRPPGYHHFFFSQKLPPPKNVTPNTKQHPAFCLNKPWFNQPSTPSPLFPQPSTPLRAYLPINYFEPSKLLEACAAKQGTKVFPGQTLIDVVLKDGWVSVGKVGRWRNPPKAGW